MRKKKRSKTLYKKKAHYNFRLFVTGVTARSQRALTNIQKLCESTIPGDYDLEVVDIYQQPVLARTEQIIAAPTLIRTHPLPLRRLIGDMSDEYKVRVSLGLQTYGG